VDESRANLARCEAERAYRKLEYERYARLAREPGVKEELADEKQHLYQAAEAACTAAEAACATSEAQLRVAEANLPKAGADVETARAAIRVAEANLAHAEGMLGYAAIKAPFAGIVTRRLMDLGAFVRSAEEGSAQPLFTIARVDRLRIIAPIPEEDASQVALGQPAAFELKGAKGRLFQGKVVRLAGTLDPETRTMRIEVELDDPAAELRPGMFGSLTIRLADDPLALLLPAAAVLYDSRRPVVFVVQAGKARQKEVAIGLNEAGRVQVIGGLTGCELVIADRNVTLRDGQPVKVVR
jgi:RND family efflux transporter MFP subunit